MSVLSLSRVPALREKLKPLGYTVHVHDACGAQAFTLEKLRDTEETAEKVVEDFFREEGMTVKFYGKLDFTAK